MFLSSARRLCNVLNEPNPLVAATALTPAPWTRTGDGLQPTGEGFVWVPTSSDLTWRSVQCGSLKCTKRVFIDNFLSFFISFWEIKNWMVQKMKR
jgi:hypothetical protein